MKAPLRKIVGRVGGHGITCGHIAVLFDAGPAELPSERCALGSRSEPNEPEAEAAR